jgi:hypothetical protein
MHYEKKLAVSKMEVHSIALIIIIITALGFDVLKYPFY